MRPGSVALRGIWLRLRIRRTATPPWRSNWQKEPWHWIRWLETRGATWEPQTTAPGIQQAIADLEKAVHLENGGSSYDYFFQAMAEHQVGHADVALRYYAKAIKGMDTYAPQNPELLRFRAEAEALIGGPTNAPAVEVKAKED